MRNRKNNVNEIINEINRTIRLMTEGYMGDEEVDMEPAINPEMGTPNLQGEMPQQPQQPQEGEEETTNLAAKDERIVQMRELALQGLQDFADDVENPFYDFYKKVWLETDKMCSHKEGE